MPGTFSVPDAQAALVAAAVDERLEFELAVLLAHVERADALGPVHLVGGDATRGRRRSRRRRTGTLPTACTASQWNSTPRSRAHQADLATGCSTPISLLAAITEIENRLVGDRRAQCLPGHQAVGTHAEVGHGEAVSSAGCLQVSRTALCSVASVMMWSPFGLQGAGDALDGEVVGLGGAAGEDDLFRARRPMSAATCRRAASTASSAFQPKACVRLAALPKCSEKYGSIASSARGSTGVVAW